MRRPARAFRTPIHDDDMSARRLAQRISGAAGRLPNVRRSKGAPLGARFLNTAASHPSRDSRLETSPDAVR